MLKERNQKSETELDKQQKISGNLCNVNSNFETSLIYQHACTHNHHIYSQEWRTESKIWGWDENCRGADAKTSKTLR